MSAQMKTRLILRRSAPSRIAIVVLVLALATAVLAGCASGGSSGAATDGKPLVVVAENFWGSIATQIGGDRVKTVSIITKPDVDPHEYEPVPADARNIARARYVISNGAGYDPWARKLLDANPAGGRRALDIADMAGRKQGGNPHMWYSPEIVGRVIDRIASDLGQIDNQNAAYFSANASGLKTTGFQTYNAVLTDIRSKYAGVAVGATESIFVDMATDLGLRLLTPPGYLNAISEGTDPAASDKAAFDQQIAARAIKVLVFNKQNSTPDVRALVDKANHAGIPVVAVTETLDPANATFQQWQGDELTALQRALARQPAA
jgi:zinc/manganese transport system substrate-binding protein